MRVNRGTTKNKTRKYVLARTKGMRGNIRKKERKAREVIAHAAIHSFQHRRKKKGDFRRAWTTRINAGVRPFGLTYSKFIDLLTKKGVTINRKMLADMAQNEPEAFKRFVEQVQK